MFLSAAALDVAADLFEVLDLPALAPCRPPFFAAPDPTPDAPFDLAPEARVPGLAGLFVAAFEADLFCAELVC